MKSRAYSVGIKGDYDGRYEGTVFAPTAAKAKYKGLLAFLDAGYDVSFQHLTCRSLGDIPIPLTPRERAERQRDAFNEQHPVGTLFHYWSGVKEGEPTGTAPSWHPATVVCDGAVIWLQGVASCHSITHVEIAGASAPAGGVN